MNPTEQLISELTAWLDSALLRGLHQLRLDDLPELERLIQTAERLGMDTLVKLLKEQTDYIRQYTLEQLEPNDWIGSFFRLAAYAKMAA
ncbi:hypothetical protein [Paenibacillus wenxiniae]|uniref:Uncharacterized protein n=1 Tax=Paenibacillus wenxiniae TaxID=1636843 RepID=A0ABW4RPE6_9BACL